MSYGQFDAGTNESEFNAISFLIKQAMLKMQTVTLVKVVGVHGAGVAPTGTVDVQPMVNQMTGDRTAVAHGTIYGVPFFRLQGGPSAFICDPVVGDIGLCGFASRDISSVKSTKAVANPGSQRTFDYADGLYVGGFINAVPTQYIEMLGGAGGINIHTPANVTIDAAAFTANAPTALESLTVNGETVLTGPTTASAITSTGVITAAGFSGPGGSSPAGPPGPAGPAGPAGPTGPAYLDVTGPGGFSLSGVTNAAFAGACTVTGSGTSITITITGGGGGGITDFSASSFFAVTNPTGPTVSLDLSASFQTALAATAALAVSALQPVTGLGGSYTNVNLTINGSGQITAVSNGSGGGGSNPFNVTPDTHTGTPSFPANDEFEESTLDLSGTRFAGAIPWTWYNQSTSIATLAEGSLALAGSGAASTQNGIGQPTPGSTWTYRAKFGVQQTSAAVACGFMVRDAANNKQAQFGVLLNAGSATVWWAALSADVLTGTTNVATNWSAYDASVNQTTPVWFELAFAASSFAFRLSRTGVDGSFRTLTTVSLAAAGLSAADVIGLSSVAGDNGAASLICDWFRRIA